MTKEERMAFIERRFRQPLPIYEDEEIKNIEVQIDVEELQIFYYSYGILE